MKVFGIIVLILVQIALAEDGGESGKTSDGQDVIEARLVNYKKFTRPKGTNASEENGGPVVINVNFYLRRIADIDEDDMEYEAELTFRQQWIDERLAYDAKHVDDDRPYLTFRHSEAARRIWTPDTFFQNAIDVREYDLMEANEMVRIYPDGTVLFSKRISLSLAQSFDFEHFPFDVHDLVLDISSYAHDEKDVIYKWRAERPIQVNNAALQDLHFNLHKVFTKQCSQKTALGHYSCLRAVFEIERRASRTQLFQFFGPSFVLVIVSWLPFMISTPSLLARALISLSALVTIILQIAIIGDEIPETHETTWAHIWLFTCFGFVVAAQLQLVAFTWFARVRANRSGSKRKLEQQRFARTTVEGNTNEHSSPLLTGKNDISDEQVPLLSFETIFDLICLSAFLLAFFIFNCYFWTAASTTGDYDDDSAHGIIIYDATKN